MKFSSFATSLVLPVLAAQSVLGYFKVTHPTSESKWANGQQYHITWEKGLRDNVDLIDIEMSTVTGEGLILVAKNVKTYHGGINIFIENIPPADNWVVICINSTHGISHGTSEPFAILASSASSEAVAETPLDKVPTVTVTSGPNPTAFFQTTLPANGAGSVRPFEGLGRGLGGVAAVVGAGVAGMAWVLL
ncbi:hypothetical protein BKA70DRAFT_1184949 [Coprinopsis sp. MPI-PUGE-AT-0042]|nr:hypothetical protein BKA70DRAFT_1184949 [Coprinopsis sp. MPI-PUGE-AT-0042]